MSLSQEPNAAEPDMLEFKNFIRRRKAACGADLRWIATQQSEAEVAVF